MKTRLCAVVLIAGFLAAYGAAAKADDAQVEEVRKVWTACEQAISTNSDGWIGWRRDFFNGYSDNFSFWDNRDADPKAPSVLRTVHLIDGTALLTTKYCFRSDGSLAFVFTVMESPNAAEGPHHGKRVSREGRIYFASDGWLLKVLGQILDEGRKPHPLDNQDWQPARGCLPFALYKSVMEVEKAYVAELGDIEGNRPAFTPAEFDWCAKAR